MNLQAAHPAVLIVDDDPDILTALHDLIEHDGFRVTDVSTCRDALAQVKAVDFAAVLLDIGLPDGDGLAVLETIQAIAPLTPRDCSHRLYITGLPCQVFVWRRILLPHQTIQSR